MKWLKRFGYCVLSLTLSALFLSLAVPALSEEPEEIIPPCFTGSELEKVKEWEKTWVGKKVNYANVDQVKDLLPDPLVQLIKDPKKWGGEIWFEIVPYRYIVASKGILEATKKYSPLSKFEPKGFKTPWGEIGPNEFLAGYEKGESAGFPFPRPKTGLEMAWNYDSLTNGDNHSKGIFGEVVNCRTGAERHANQPMTRMYWSGRTEMPPLPRIEPNPKGFRRTYFQTLIEPHDMYGTNYMEYRYMNPRKEDDTYIWVAMYRRIRRLSSSQRGDTIDGSDQSYCDQEGYGDQVNRNTYKFLEVKDMLGVRHQDGSKLTKQKGQGFWSGTQPERCKLYLVEAVNKDKTHIYSKEIWYLDGETWQMAYKICWDRQGRPWRFLGSQPGIGKSKQGEPVTYAVSYNYTDMQRLHGSPNFHKDPEFGMELDAEMFTLQYLQRVGR
jgi:hypothetical protein